MNRITILMGLLGLLIGTGLILPALAQLRDQGSMPSAAVGPYTAGIVLVLIGGSTTVFAFRRRKTA